MNSRKYTTESATTATKLALIDVTMTLHLIASDIRVMRAALAEGDAEHVTVADVAHQLDRVHRQLDDFASEVHERGVAS